MFFLVSSRSSGNTLMDIWAIIYGEDIRQGVCGKRNVNKGCMQYLGQRLGVNSLQCHGTLGVGAYSPLQCITLANLFTYPSIMQHLLCSKQFTDITY